LSRYESERQPRTAWITDRSWETGRVGQLENPLACALRNFIMRMTPESVFKSRLAQAAGYRI
jgi:2-polyprenyl-6-methoxyphenol hydroxylase-like FAD-dependent oxidoreductase